MTVLASVTKCHQVSPAYQHEDIARLDGKEARVVRLLVADGPEEVLLVQAGEGRLANQHFIQKHPERPPVNALVVLLTFDDLEKHTL